MVELFHDSNLFFDEINSIASADRIVGVALRIAVQG